MKLWAHYYFWAIAKCCVGIVDEKKTSLIESLMRKMMMVVVAVMNVMMIMMMKCFTWTLCRSSVVGRHANTHRQWQVGFKNLRDKVKVSLTITANFVPRLKSGLNTCFCVVSI